MEIYNLMRDNISIRKFIFLFDKTFFEKEKIKGSQIKKLWKNKTILFIYSLLGWPFLNLISNDWWEGILCRGERWDVEMRRYLM